jgi:type II/IV secretion system protein
MSRNGSDVSPRDGAGDTALRETLHRRLLDAPFDPSGLGGPELRARLARMLREEDPLLSSSSAAVVLDELVDDVGGLGPLEPLLADPTISEVMVNGPDRVFVERAGRLVAVDCRIDAATIVRVVERVIAPLGLRLDRASPMVDARLADGSRLHAVLPPLAPSRSRRSVSIPSSRRTSTRWCARVGTSSCPAQRARARPRVATRWRGRSTRRSGS